MPSILRRLTIVPALLVTALLVIALLSTQTMQASARPQGTAESMLVNAANRDRAAAGLPALQWDATLAAAARAHAIRMAQMNQLSHQLPGEGTLQERATQAGARFSVIAENVAESDTVTKLHSLWMNSAPHRANLLDPELNAVGIAVVQAGNILYAVEDFSASVANLDVQAQEVQVGSQLAAHGLHVTNANPDARKTCDMDRGWAGQRPLMVLRYETSDLTRLPADIEQKALSGKYHSAVVGACDAGGLVGFTRFRIAILLY
jgi:uncharacterized protein YkwD